MARDFWNNTRYGSIYIVVDDLLSLVVWTITLSSHIKRCGRVTPSVGGQGRK